ncbi:MAG: Gfo/Idh/MocA family oxidoreductase [Ignisphaera sp.]|uniref:Gfo/Idh/MocA family oxidoreductase n=1 Tax=Ignisphaera aggregans TaxID=334771 RepID=A0A7J3JMY7_9CREN
MKTVNVAVVGLGAIGRRHVESLKELELEGYGVKLIAVMDVLKGRVDEFASRYGCRGYTTYDDVVRDPEIDVVSIATPHYLHAQQAIYAMEHKKHVIVEKPMAITLASAKEMILKARKNGVRLGVVYQRRYSEAIQKLREMVCNGVLGKVFLAEASLMWYRDEEDYFLKDEIARSWRGLLSTEGGGLLMTQAIHVVDLLIFLFREAEEAYGYIDNVSHPSIDVEDTTTAIIKFKNRVTASLTASISFQPPDKQYWRIRVFGTKGFAEVENETFTQIQVKDQAIDHIAYEKKRENLHKKLFKDFLTKLQNDEDFPINGEEGYKSLELVKAIYYSTILAKPTKIPLNINLVI